MTKTYNYQSKIVPTLLGLILFGAMSWFFISRGMNHEAFDYKGAHFEADAAIYIHYGFGVLCTVFTLMSLYALFQRFAGEPKVIEVTATEIILPKLLLADKKVLRFADISSVKETAIKKQRILEIKAAQEKGSVSSALLTKEEYEEIKQTILEKSSVNQQRPNSVVRT
ncbi:MAG: hypothetical protein DI551_09970 [Micavibrio aeruginosavorus]|uniref:Uncharacterized protein n=1 Tax=Micavibrio aeruginosavorus TaxID=349221 RepID=A0A2W5PPT6_9BACT|nr:MAG: hypothetical protein DI551_09970 [Micavibrio aeruginosavorus]